MRHCVIKRLEAGLLVMTAVLFLYAPANEAGSAAKTEYRFRAVELVQELAGWFETTFSQSNPST